MNITNNGSAAIEADEDSFGKNYDEATIFVSVPSYRDSETPKTLQHLFLRAAHPERITMLVNEQNEPFVLGKHKDHQSNDVSAVSFPGVSKYQQNIRLLQMDSTDAKGPIVARALIEQKLYTPGEADYWLQIDSHTAAIKNWDQELIRQLHLLDSPSKSVLTTFPADFDPAHRTAVAQLSLPNFIGFHDFNTARGLPTQQRYQFRAFPNQPRESLFYSAGFAFSTAAVPETIPYDPHMDYMFLGEEISMAARLFTNGFKMFSPVNMPIFHLSTRGYRPVFWEQIYRKNCKVNEPERLARKELESAALRRVQTLMFHGVAPPENNGVYGLGSVKSLEEFEDHIGVRLKEQDACPRARLGIVANASDDEWREKYKLPRQSWQMALKQLVPPRTTA